MYHIPGDEGLSIKEVCVKADTQYIDEVFDFIEGELATIEGISRQEVLKIHMIVDEIFSNIANYAYMSDDSGNVTVSFDHDSETKAVSITFTDQGRPYNPLEETPPDVTLPAGKRKVGGLGVFMVRNTVDDIKYENRDGMNILTIVKKTEGETP